MLKVTFGDIVNGENNDEFSPAFVFDINDNGDLIVAKPDGTPVCAYARGIWKTAKREN